MVSSDEKISFFRKYQLVSEGFCQTKIKAFTMNSRYVFLSITPWGSGEVDHPRYWNCEKFSQITSKISNSKSHSKVLSNFEFLGKFGGQYDKWPYILSHFLICVKLTIQPNFKIFSVNFPFCSLDNSSKSVQWQVGTWKECEVCWTAGQKEIILK